MNRKLAKFFLLIFVLSPDPSQAFSQKRDAVKPPAETASLSETQQWIIANFAKHASFKTRTNAGSGIGCEIRRMHFAFCTDAKDRIDVDGRDGRDQDHQHVQG
jgi:hypothetical protein